MAVLMLLVLPAMSPVGAQTPDAADGEVVVVPVLAPGDITIDGDLGDWATLPSIVTISGPTPSADPAVAGELRWQVAATDGFLHVAATITDDQIVAGQNGDNFWNEDSIEIYLNFGDQDATTYGEGIGQITISAVDRGNSDPEALTLSGNGAPNFNVAGFVFPTTAGWGFEVAISTDGITQVADQATFGFQIQANGSSGDDRDLKLSWSIADTSDTSFQDPSVFGLAVFSGDSGAGDATQVDDGAVASVDPVVDAADQAEGASVIDTETSTVESTGAAADDEPAGRMFLVAAIVAAAAVLIGGLLFERRRRKTEAEMAAAKASEPEPDASEEEVNALIASILDEEE